MNTSASANRYENVTPSSRRTPVLEALERRALFDATSASIGLVSEEATAPQAPASVPIFSPIVLDAQFDDERAPHSIRVRFDQDISQSLDSGDLVLINQAGRFIVPADQIAVSWDHNTATATFALTGLEGGLLAEGTWQATIRAQGITNPQGDVMEADHSFSFGFMQGDANRDGVVNLADFNILAANFGQTDRTFSQGDLNYDGVVNLADFQVLASRMGQRQSQTPIGVPAQPTHTVELADVIESAYEQPSLPA